MAKKGNVTPKGEDVAGTTQDEGLTANPEVVSGDSQPKEGAEQAPEQDNIPELPNLDELVEKVDYLIPSIITSEEEAIEYITNKLPHLIGEAVIVTSDRNVFTNENFSSGYNHAASNNLKHFRVQV